MDLDFQYHMSSFPKFFVLSELRWETIARFVDIGEIVDIHNLFEQW
jgi:hypothetical protein